MPPFWKRLELQWPDIALAACLFALLVAVYTFTYQGTIRSGDETLFIAGAQSLSRLGKFHIGAVFGDRGDGPYEIEPGQAVIGAVLDAAARLAGVGSAHTLFLLNVYATALTAVGVYGLTRQQGFLPGVALGAALLYGMGTLAWPHATYYFRDPLAAMWGIFGVWSYEALFTRKTLRGQLLQWALTLSLLALAVATKQTTAFVAVAVLLVTAVRAVVTAGERRAALAGLGPIALAGALSLLLPAEGALGRLSAWRYLGLAAGLVGQPLSAYFGEAASGLLFSPGKGLFIESPALLLAFVAVPLTARVNWPRLLLPWLALILLVVVTPLYRDYIWWGGLGWGVRHILPIAPLLAAACAPTLQAVWETRSIWPRGLVGALLVLSGMIQIGAVTGSLSAYYARLGTLGVPGAAWTMAIWDFRYSEMLGYWQTLLAGERWAWAWVRLLEVRASWLIAAFIAVLIAASVVALALLGRLLRRPSTRPQVAALLLALALVSVVPYVWLRLLSPDPDYVAWRADFRQAVELVSREAQPGDVVLVRGYLFPIWKYALNYATWRVPWYAFSPQLPAAEGSAAIREAQAPERALAADTRALLEERLLSVLRGAKAARRLWLINDQGAPAGDLRFEEWWLAQRAAPLQSVGDLTRVTVFDLAASRSLELSPAQFQFGPALTLSAWGVSSDAAVGFRPGGSLAVALRWQTTMRLESNHNVGVYVLDSNGVLVAQHDSQPVSGFQPFTTWPPGAQVVDWHGLLLPAALPEGEYQLAVAVYDPQTLARLPVNGPQGPAPDGLAYLGVFISRP